MILKKKRTKSFCPIFPHPPFISVFRSRIYIVYSNTGNGCDLVLFIVRYWKKNVKAKKFFLCPFATFLLLRYWRCCTRRLSYPIVHPPSPHPENEAFIIFFSSWAEYPCLYACSCYAIPISLLFCRFSVSTASVSEMWPSGLRGVRLQFHAAPEYQRAIMEVGGWTVLIFSIGFHGAVCRTALL